VCAIGLCILRWLKAQHFKQPIMRPGPRSTRLSSSGWFCPKPRCRSQTKQDQD
jgi:hypothetical protein